MMQGTVQTHPRNDEGEILFVVSPHPLATPKVLELIFSNLDVRVLINRKIRKQNLRE